MEKKQNMARVFTDINAKVSSGILFNNQGSMFVARDKQVNRITPNGEVSMFISLNELPAGKNYFFESPLIWDMVYDGGNDILAAAQDRILKISPEGEITTLVREDFNGFLGASAIALDKNGSIYATNGSQVIKYTKNLERSVYIDATSGKQPFHSFFSMSFDPDYNNLYLTDFYTKTVLRYPIMPDGSAGEPDIIIREPVKDSGNFGAPLNIVFSENRNMYVSIDGMGQIMKMDTNGNIELLSLGSGVMNHIIAFGKEGFDPHSLYITTYDGKSVYQLDVGEKGYGN